MNRSFDPIIRSRQVIVTCGTGGVGKTTLSAALAVRAATLGRKAVVITIDPAKRLVSSLGLSELGDRASDLTDELKRFEPSCTGEFWALMPDTQQTFEGFFRDLASSEEVANRIIHNPIFKILAREYSGANEYMALQKLHTVRAAQKYDLIILDTPPSRNTLAFFQAPGLLSRFFQERMIRTLVKPASKIVQTGMDTVLNLLGKLTGAGFLRHLMEFAQALFEIEAGFTKNLEGLKSLFRSKDVGFSLVAGLNPEMADELDHFLQTLDENRFNFDGLILNRTFGALQLTAEELERANLRAKEGESSYLAAYEVLKDLQKRESLVVTQLSNRISNIGGDARVFVTLPELTRDIHSLKDLYYVSQTLGEKTETPPRLDSSRSPTL